MTQLSLDFTPRTRSTDPASSHDAARAHRQQAKTNRERLLHLVVGHEGRTTKELAALSETDGGIVLDRHEAARRMAELVKAGLVRREGPGELRCYATGRQR